MTPSPQQDRCVLTRHDIQSIKDLIFILSDNVESSAQKAIFEILANNMRSSSKIQRSHQCTDCLLNGLRLCMYHGYRETTIPPICDYRIVDIERSEYCIRELRSRSHPSPAPTNPLALENLTVSAVCAYEAGVEDGKKQANAAIVAATRKELLAKVERIKAAIKKPDDIPDCCEVTDCLRDSCLDCMIEELIKSLRHPSAPEQEERR